MTISAVEDTLLPLHHFQHLTRRFLCSADKMRWAILEENKKSQKETNKDNEPTGELQCFHEPLYRHKRERSVNRQNKPLSPSGESGLFSSREKDIRIKLAKFQQAKAAHRSDPKRHRTAGRPERNKFSDDLGRNGPFKLHSQRDELSRFHSGGHVLGGVLPLVGFINVMFEGEVIRMQPLIRLVWNGTDEDSRWTEQSRDIRPDELFVAQMFKDIPGEDQVEALIGEGQAVLQIADARLDSLDGGRFIDIKSMRLPSIPGKPG